MALKRIQKVNID